MTDASPAIDPRRTALLVMDYQNAIVGRLDEPGALLARMADAIALVRSHGGQIGHVRVAFRSPRSSRDSPARSRAARSSSANRARAERSGSRLDAIRHNSPRTRGNTRHLTPTSHGQVFTLPTVTRPIAGCQHGITAYAAGD
jgi:nicotinamidase-related amidase